MAINQKLHQTNVQFLPLDLGDLKNVRSFVKSWGEKKLPPIAILLLNAGLQFPAEIQYTADGFEATFGVNHVGHALLFHLLQPYLADEARIVITASGTHDPAQKSGLPDAKYTTAEELAHPAGEGLTIDGKGRYSTSKLCNILWTYALARRLKQLPDKKWTVVAFDPGLMPGTGLAREYNPVLRFLWNRVMPALIPLLRLIILSNIHKPQESGASLAYTALDEKERATNGVYYEGRKQIKSSVDSYDEAKQEDLWAWTVKTLAADDQERHQFEVVA
jgi:NAD(P)-dependent dehydrogenase (short-subunit alcohol dehydrogenase family)